MINDANLTALDELLFRFGVTKIAKTIKLEKIIGYAAVSTFGYAFSRSFSKIEGSAMTHPITVAAVCLLTSISMNFLKKKEKIGVLAMDEKERWSSRGKIVIHHLPILCVAAAILLETTLTHQPMTISDVLRPCAFVLGADMVGNEIKKKTHRFLVG